MCSVMANRTTLAGYAYQRSCFLVEMLREQFLCLKNKRSFFTLYDSYISPRLSGHQRRYFREKAGVAAYSATRDAI